MIFTISSFGQKITNNEIDKFTKSHIVETSNVNFYTTFINWCSISGKKIDNYYYLKLDISGSGNMESIPIDPGLMFMLDNDSIVILHPLNTVIPSRNIQGKWTMVIKCHIKLKDYESLINHNIIIFRYYTTSGYIEKNIKEKNSGNIRSILKLLAN